MFEMHRSTGDFCERGEIRIVYVRLFRSQAYSRSVHKRDNRKNIARRGFEALTSPSPPPSPPNVAIRSRVNRN